MEPVTVNFAMTRDDYMSGQLARAKSGTARTETIAVKIFGIFLILLAFLLLLTRTTQSWLSAVAMAGGIFLLFLCRPLLHAIVRRKAADDFEAGRCGMPAQTVSFDNDRVCFRTERYEGHIPYGMLARAYEDGSVFLLFTGEDECRCIPKRTLDKQNQKRVEDLLKSRMKQKFVQEGAHEWTK